MKHSTLRIIAKHTFTLFNLVNLILAIMVALVGSYKNMLFIGVAIANTLISVINELRAKKIVDKLQLLSEKRPTIIENGKTYTVSREQVKKGDHLLLSIGDQVLFDTEVISGFCEVNESFITGEQASISKRTGDKLTSGSFIVAGSVEAKVINVGADNFVTKLQTEASAIKTADSKLFTLMNKIVKYISYTLIPVGALLLWARFRTEPNATEAVTSTVAALINMIPEGLILLTSSVLALATVRLGKQKVLVQDLYAIETLARVDTICLDKTGTLTTGNLAVRDFIIPDTTKAKQWSYTVTSTLKGDTPAEKSLLSPLASILSHTSADNATSTALKAKLARSAKNKPTGDFAKIDDFIPFSSDRKYSGIRVGHTEYLMGAIEFLIDDEDTIRFVKSLAADGLRLLAVVKREVSAGGTNTPSRVFRSAGDRRYSIEDRKLGRAPLSVSEMEHFGQDPRFETNIVPGPAMLLGIIRLEDEIRPTAPAIIDYFYKNNIAVKIISGDDLSTVTTIAGKVGVKDLTGVDLSTLKSKNYAKLVRDYAIFSRVTPSEKKELVKAMKKQGRTVAMTGDGVNDILAMKEADASLAIGDGSDAARRAAKFVLLDSGFESVPAIIDEGRQSINNLERSTSLFLAKTVYASILAVVFVFLPFSYPFKPIEMTLLNFACIGLPGLILALEKNTERIKDKFTTNILEYSVPVGITVSIAMIALAVIAGLNEFPRYELSSAAVFVTFAIDFILIYRISRPMNPLRLSLLITILAIMAVIFLWPFARDFFEFAFLTKNGLIVTLVLIASSVALFEIFHFLAKRLSARLHH